MISSLKADTNITTSTGKDMIHAASARITGIDESLLHCSRPDTIHILVWAHVIYNAQCCGRLLVTQEFQHLRAHLPDLASWDSEELVLLGPKMATDKE